MESDLHMYIQSSDRAWSPILLNIILIETDLYLSWRVPDLTWIEGEIFLNREDRKNVRKSIDAMDHMLQV